MRSRSHFAGGLGFAWLLLALAAPAQARDRVPPAAVTDMRVVSVEPSAVTLMFTATGDDGLVGQATSYDLRFATSEITASTWNSAHTAYHEPAPQPSGAVEFITLSSLFPDITYYFALRVADEAGNLSGLSNVPFATTPPAPPSSWAVEVLPTVGQAKSLDFFGGDGEFSIGCGYAEEHTVVALLFDGVVWHREVVDTNIAWGAGIDFTFAPDGTPTMSYGCNWKGMRKGTRFAWRSPNGTWSAGDVEKVENGCATDLEYDPLTGEPTVVYTKNEAEVRFARKVGGLAGAWQIETVALTAIGDHDMVYDVEGRPVVAFSGDNPDALRIATKIGDAWEVESLHECERCGRYASIAVDESGNLLAADNNRPYNAPNYSITVFRKEPGGASWSGGEVVATQAAELRAAFDGQGVPYVVFFLWDDGTVSRPNVASDTGGLEGWQIERVSFDNARWRPDIARDPEGGLGVLYNRADGGMVLARKQAPR
jgi:hypothetical protein